MLLIEQKTIGIYNYQGKLIAQPRWPNMRVDCIKAPLISLSNDTLAVRDINDQTSIRNWFYFQIYLLTMSIFLFQRFT